MNQLTEEVLSAYRKEFHDAFVIGVLTQEEYRFLANAENIEDLLSRLEKMRREINQKRKNYLIAFGLFFIVISIVYLILNFKL